MLKCPQGEISFDVVFCFVAISHGEIDVFFFFSLSFYSILQFSWLGQCRISNALLMGDTGGSEELGLMDVFMKNRSSII